MSLEDPASISYSASVPAIINAISYEIEPRYITAFGCMFTVFVFFSNVCSALSLFLISFYTESRYVEIRLCSFFLSICIHFVFFS